MPSSIRPPDIRFRVANKLAVTVRSLVAGLVTHVPRRMRLVLAAISVSRGYGSFHNTCESNIQPYLKPAASACLVRPTMRSTEMSGFSVMPNCIAGPFRYGFVSGHAEACQSELNEPVKVPQCSIEFLLHPANVNCKTLGMED